MSNEQVRETLAAGKKFIDGDWDEDHPDEHEWKEHLPYGYAADGVRIRTCEECGLSLVFNLDSQKDALIEGGEAPIQMCGEEPQPKPWDVEVTVRYLLEGAVARTEEDVREAVEEFISTETLTVPVRLEGLKHIKYSPDEIEVEAWET